MPDDVMEVLGSPASLVGNLSGGGTISGELSSPSFIEGIVNKGRDVSGLFNATQQQMSGRLNNILYLIMVSI